MDDLQRQALRLSTVDLSDNMNPSALTAHLYQRKLLTKDEFERVSLPNMTTLDKNLFILQKLPSKGPRAFDLFVECLQQSGEDPHLQLARDLTQKLEELTNMHNGD